MKRKPYLFYSMSQRKKNQCYFLELSFIPSGSNKKGFPGWLDFCFTVTAMLFFLRCRGHADTLWKSSGFDIKDWRTCWSCEPSSALCFPLTRKSRLPNEGSEWPHPSGVLPGPPCSVILTVLTLKRKTAFIWLPKHHTLILMSQTIEAYKENVGSLSSFLPNPSRPEITSDKSMVCASFPSFSSF